MRLRLALFVAVLSSGCVATAAFAAPDQEGKSPVYERVKLRFTSKDAASRTGFVWDVKQRAVAVDAQPPPVRRARLRFPRGTRFDTSAVVRCTATDGELQERGTEACPAESRLGGGSGTVFLGSPDHLAADVDVFNAKRSALLVVSTQTGDVLRVLRGVVRGSVIDASVPPALLPGGKEAALTSLKLRLRAAGTRAKPWLRTPKRCPARRAWKFVYDIDYDDPPGRQTPFSRSRCRR
jgi:hypothetical protein